MVEYFYPRANCSNCCEKRLDNRRERDWHLVPLNFLLLLLGTCCRMLIWLLLLRGLLGNRGLSKLSRPLSNTHKFALFNLLSLSNPTRCSIFASFFKFAVVFFKLYFFIFYSFICYSIWFSQFFCLSFCIGFYLL